MNLLINSAAVVLLLLCATAYLPWQFLWIDIGSHFILQYFISAVLLLILAALFKTQPGCFYILGISLFLCLYQLYPFIPFTKETAIADQTRTLKILETNVLRSNTNIAPLRDLITAESPDIIVASEVNTAFSALFQKMGETYPYQVLEPEDKGSYGMAVLSKFPIDAVAHRFSPAWNIPTLFVKIKYSSRIIDLVSLHPATPLYGMKDRDDTLRQIEDWHQQNTPTYLIVTGDMNATPYCPAYKRLRQAISLTDARQGRGIFATWPQWLPVFMRLPIDHLLVNQNIHIMNFRLGPDIGSDHLPTLTVLAMKDAVP